MVAHLGSPLSVHLVAIGRNHRKLLAEGGTMRPTEARAEAFAVVEECMLE